jgi:hypothetical protein
MQSSPSASQGPVAAALELLRARVLEVRADGTVWKLRNLNRMPFKAPRQIAVLSKRGYLLVNLCLWGRPHVMTAHRLVWLALRGPIPPGMDINHIDGCKTNNHPDNLELATRSENIRHAYRTGLRKGTDVPGALSERAKELRATGKSFSQIAADLGVSQTTAFRAVRNK